MRPTWFILIFSKYLVVTISFQQINVRGTLVGE